MWPACSDRIALFKAFAGDGLRCNFRQILLLSCWNRGCSPRRDRPCAAGGKFFVLSASCRATVNLSISLSSWQDIRPKNETRTQYATLRPGQAVEIIFSRTQSSASNANSAGNDKKHLIAVS
jgi:hypothetical protein